MHHDIVIRGGTIYDGTGRDPIDADIAIDGNTIVTVGTVPGRGEEEIDASHRIVTPGFVDLHTHMDAQIAWDASLSPLSSHGVTSILLGNCSVTFAPCSPENRDFLANMMETVEDIPSHIIREGMAWDWETYSEYLASIERCQPAINLSGLVGHAAIRFHVLGERAISKTRDEEPDLSEEELRQMVDLVESSVRGGAVGLSLNRLEAHVLPDRRPIPGTWASHAEIVALARAAQEAGGFVQLVPNIEDSDDDKELFRAITQDAGARLLFSSVVEQVGSVGQDVEAMRAAGSSITGLTLPRRFGFVSGLTTVLPFRGSFWRSLESLDLEGKLAVLNDPEKRRALVEQAKSDGRFATLAEKVRWLGDGDHPQYVRTESLADEARSAGCDPVDLFFDRCRDSGGLTLFHIPFANIDPDDVLEHLERDWVLPGLGDAGAHASQICDAGFATFYLSHWGRDRGAVSLSTAVSQLTSAPASVLGLKDRGTLVEGMCADLNVIDLDQLAECQPHVVNDLPLGGRRLVQGAQGYDATLCNGVVVNRNDGLTGNVGGRVLRTQSV